MSNKIIGGEYAIDKTTESNNDITGKHNLYPSGRAALRAILNHALPNGAGSVLIPDHICGSVPQTVSKMGLTCCFYHINEDFTVDTDSIASNLSNVDAILLVNYFGMTPSTQINQLTDHIRSIKSGITVIVDDVQNYYGLEEKKKCDYAFTSLRKWFPVPDGSYIIRNSDNVQEYIYPTIDPKDAHFPMFSKYKYAGNILKSYRNVIGDDICLELIEKGEELIDTDNSDIALPWTVNAMEHIDHKEIKQQRQRNAAILHEGLADMGIFHLYSNEAVPLFVPIILEKERDSIRRTLFDNSIFCPVHWNDGWQKSFTGLEINPLSATELSLICDQRYNEEDMYRQLYVLRKALVL